MIKKILKVIVLGATGNLGSQSLEVLSKYKKDFQIIGLSSYQKGDALNKLAKKYQIPAQNVVLASRDGEKAVAKLAENKEADIIINVISGINGIAPAIKALQKGKILLLGNKESLVAEGEKIMSLLQKKSVAKSPARLIPLDSEHNAIFEILKKKFGPNLRLPLNRNQQKQIKKIYLSCSGGPFFGKIKRDLQNITIKNVLAHPKWKMGQKISIESALLINKGLEIIEAHYLFGLPLNKIGVFVHPECQVHAKVEFVSPKISARAELAYISPPDMRLHIENALLEILRPDPRHLSPAQIRPLRAHEFLFYKPDHKTFPGIKIVLKHFQKNPQKMSQFLQSEERHILDFLDQKTTFLQLIENLSKIKQ